MRNILTFAALSLTEAVHIDRTFIHNAPIDVSNIHLHQRDDDAKIILGIQTIQDKAMDIDTLNALMEGPKPEEEEEDYKPKPLATFNTPYDHEGHKHEAVAMDAYNVNMTKNVTKEGPYCQMDEWAIVKWKAWSIDTDKSTRKLKDDVPAAFQLGRYKVSKCWEIAIQ